MPGKQCFVAGESLPIWTERVEWGKMSRNWERIARWQHFNSGTSDRNIAGLTTWKHCWIQKAMCRRRRYPDWDVQANLTWEEPRWKTRKWSQRNAQINCHKKVAWVHCCFALLLHMVETKSLLKNQTNQINVISTTAMILVFSFAY